MQHRYYTLFVQDDVRLTSKLTVNFGLRWDPRAGMRQYGNNDEAWIPGQQSTQFPKAPVGLVFYGDKGLENGSIRNSYNDFAPRVGLAYNFAPKTVLRSAYGIFYDEFQSILYNSITQQFPWANQTTLTGPLSFSDPFAGGTLDRQPVMSVTCVPFLAGVPAGGLVDETALVGEPCTPTTWRM